MRLSAKQKYYLKVTGLFLVGAAIILKRDWQVVEDYLALRTDYMFIWPLVFIALLFLMESRYPEGRQAKKIIINSKNLTLISRYVESGPETIIPYTDLVNYKIIQGVRDRLVGAHTLEIWYINNAKKEEYINIGGLRKQDSVRLEGFLSIAAEKHELVGVVDGANVYGVDQSAEDIQKRRKAVGRAQLSLEVIFGVLVGIIVLLLIITLVSNLG